VEKCDDSEESCEECVDYVRELKEEDDWWKEFFMIEKIENPYYEFPVLIPKK